MSDKFQKTLSKSQKVLDIFKDKPIDVLKYSKKDFKVELERLPEQPYIEPDVNPVQEIADEPTVNLHQVTSKFVGSFQPTKIKAGEKVSTGDIIGNIFSMNINHPIKADKSGILHDFLVEQDDAVDYGAAIATIE